MIPGNFMTFSELNKMVVGKLGLMIQIYKSSGSKKNLLYFFFRWFIPVVFDVYK